MNRTAPASGLFSSGKGSRHFLFGVAVFGLLLSLPVAPAFANGALDADDLPSGLYLTDALTAPTPPGDILDSDPIEVTWDGLHGTQVAIYTALSPEPLAEKSESEQAEYLPTLTWRLLEERLPNTGSFTLPAGTLQPDSTHLLLVKSGFQEWDVPDGELNIIRDTPEIPCEAVTTVPSPTPTMQLSGGTWGNYNAQWTDLTNTVPPRTAPDSSDIVRVSGSATFSTTTTVAGLIIASGVTLTGTVGTLTVNGPLVNNGTITGNFTTRITQVGAYNLGTSWNNSNLQFYGGTDANDRRPLEIMADASHLFGNANSKTNGYLEFIGCAALPGILSFEATDLLIDAPSKITLNQAQYNPVISGSGALEIQGSATGTDFGIQPDATNGPLQYLIFSGSGTQTIRLKTSTPGGITAQTVQLVNGTKELISTTGTITGNLDILPTTPTTTLRNASSASKTLTVDGNVRNYGTVTNYDGTKLLTVKVSGNLQNSGTWENSFTELTGTGARRINGGLPLYGNIKVIGSFELQNSVRIPNHLYFGAGSTPAYLSFPESLPAPRVEVNGSLYGYGGGLTRGRLLLNYAGNQYIQTNLTADRIELSGGGLKRVYSQTFTGDLLVDNGTTLTTWYDATSSLYVWGDVVNYGTIRNRTDGPTAGRTLRVDVAGDLLNQGDGWTNSTNNVQWAAVPSATAYEVNFTNSSNPDDWAAPINTGTNRIRSIAGLLTSTRYWRTRAQVGGVWQDWSPVHSINVNHAPDVTLAGDDPLQLMLGDTYDEPGATASDAEDGDVTGSLVINTTQLDLNTPGTYHVAYTAYDRIGLSTEVLRTVEVVALPAPTNLEQLDPKTSPSPTAVPIPLGYAIGGTAAENTVKFRAVVAPPENDQFGLQVEVRDLTELGGQFDVDQGGPGVLQTALVSSSQTVTTSAFTAAPGNYHWRARTIDGQGHFSEWVEFPLDPGNPTADTDFEYGFEPSPHGFKFPNNGIDGSTLSGVDENGNMSTDENGNIKLDDTDRWDIFDSTFALPSPVPDALRIEAFRAAQLDKLDWFQDGNCFGMDVAAAASYTLPEFMAAHYPDYWTIFQAAGSTWELNAPGPVLPVLWDGAGIANKPVMKAIASLQAAHQSEEYMNTPKTTSPGAILSELSQLYPTQFGQYIMSVRYVHGKSDLGAHNLAPYRIEQTGPSQGRIYVYDSNYPDTDGTGESETAGNTSYSRYIEILDADTWEYEFQPGDVWPHPQSEEKTIRLVNVVNLLENVDHFTPVGFGAKPFVMLEGAGDLLLTNPENNQIGIDATGTYVHTIPDEEAQLVDNFVPDQMTQHYYFMQDTDLKAEVTGTLTGMYELIKMKNNTIIHIFVPTVPGLKDTINLSDDSVNTFTLTFDDDVSRANQTFSVEVYSKDYEITQFGAPNLPFIPGATIRFAIGNDSVLVSIDYDGNGTYDFNSSLGSELTEPAAPVTTASIAGTQNPDQSYQPGATVTLTAQDNTHGVGVRQKEYSLDGGSTWDVYTAPIEFNDVGAVTLSYRSRDGFDNLEDSNSLGIVIANNP